MNLEILSDVGIHLALEAIGGLILAVSYRFCGHFWHRALIWSILAPPMSYATVQLVG